MLSRSSLRIIVESGKYLVHPDDRVVDRPTLDRLESEIRAKIRGVGFGLKFTDHFYQRLSHTRNKPPLRTDEVKSLFLGVMRSKKLRGKLVSKGEGYEGVLVDTKTKLNAPFSLSIDRRGRVLDIIPHTVMRKNDFKSHQPKHVVVSESFRDGDFILIEYIYG